jgi:hypothetical protein
MVLIKTKCFHQKKECAKKGLGTRRLENGKTNFRIPK